MYYILHRASNNWSLPDYIHIFREVEMTFRNQIGRNAPGNDQQIKRKLLQFRLINSFLLVSLLGTTRIYPSFQPWRLPQKDNVNKPEYINSSGQNTNIILEAF
jgi:hypothetical protein